MSEIDTESGIETDDYMCAQCGRPELEHEGEECPTDAEPADAVSAVAPEREVAPWSVIETLNGNRYVVLPNRMQAYIGNAELDRSDKSMLLPERPDSSVRVVGRVVLARKR